MEDGLDEVEPIRRLGYRAHIERQGDEDRSRTNRPPFALPKKSDDPVRQGARPSKLQRNTVILAHGGTLREVQNILGHSDANITAKVYAHLVPGFLETAVNRRPIGKRPTPKPAPTPHCDFRVMRANSPKRQTGVATHVFSHRAR